MNELLIRGGILLNFSPHGFWGMHPFRLELVWYPTNEHFFQSGKSLCSNRGATVHEMVMEYADPGGAKSAGRNPGIGLDVERWNNVIAPRRMLEGLVLKFTQNDEAREALFATGLRPLIEHRPDPIWGDNMDGSGKNLMGIGLMYVRDKLGAKR